MDLLQWSTWRENRSTVDDNKGLEAGVSSIIYHGVSSDE